MILETSMTLALPRDRVFAFFADAENLERITPDELHFRILTPLPLRMEPGKKIDYRLRLFGVPFRWQSEISLWNPPVEFIDTQVKGPYAEWVHHHLFFEEGPNRTRVVDRVRYRPPGGIFGRLALPLVRRELQRIFSFREKRLRALLEK